MRLMKDEIEKGIGSHGQDHVWNYDTARNDLPPSSFTLRTLPLTLRLPSSSVVDTFSNGPLRPLLFSVSSPTLFPMNAQDSLTVLLFHGSRHPQAALEAAALAGRIAVSTGGEVVIAFLQMASPLLPDVLAAAAGEGRRHVRIFPLFTLTGAHVAEDIPAVVGRFREKVPDLRIDLEPHLAADRSFEDWLSRRLVDGVKPTP